MLDQREQIWLVFKHFLMDFQCQGRIGAYFLEISIITESPEGRELTEFAFNWTQIWSP